MSELSKLTNKALWDVVTQGVNPNKFPLVVGEMFRRLEDSEAERDRLSRELTASALRLQKFEFAGLPVNITGIEERRRTASAAQAQDQAAKDRADLLDALRFQRACREEDQALLGRIKAALVPDDSCDTIEELVELRMRERAQAIAEAGSYAGAAIPEKIAEIEKEYADYDAARQLDGRWTHEDGVRRTLTNFVRGLSKKLQKYLVLDLSDEVRTIQARHEALSAGTTEEAGRLAVQDRGALLRIVVELRAYIGDLVEHLRRISPCGLCRGDGVLHSEMRSCVHCGGKGWNWNAADRRALVEALEKQQASRQAVEQQFKLLLDLRELLVAGNSGVEHEKIVAHGDPGWHELTGGEQRLWEQISEALRKSTDLGREIDALFRAGQRQAEIDSGGARPDARTRPGPWGSSGGAEATATSRACSARSSPRTSGRRCGARLPGGGGSPDPASERHFSTQYLSGYSWRGGPTSPTPTCAAATSRTLRSATAGTRRRPSHASRGSRRTGTALSCSTPCSRKRSCRATCARACSCSFRSTTCGTRTARRRSP